MADKFVHEDEETTVKVLAYKSRFVGDRVEFTESTGEHIISDNPEQILDWLICDALTDYRNDPETKEDTVRVTWELGDTLAPFFRLLGDKCKELHTTHKTKVGPYSLWYSADKVLSVRHGACPKYQLQVFHLAQYFPNDEVENDLQQLVFRGQYVLESLHKMKFYPSRLTSPVRIFQECVLEHLDVPGADDMPKEAAMYALRCSGKLWIEAHKIGYFYGEKQLYDYDLNSAFPTVAANLYDTRPCQWIQSSEFQDNSVYGYAKGKVRITSKVSPIIHINEHGESSCPVGTWETYLTKEEILFIRKWDIGTFEIESGWWAIPQRDYGLPKPLEHVAKRLLKYKESGGMVKELAKRMSVGGLYGKFGEEFSDRFGPNWNPCWFAEISSRVRLKVAEFIYYNSLQDNVCHVSVDGVLTDAPAQMVRDDWKFGGQDDALILSSGLLFMGKKHPKGLHLAEVIAMIQSHPRRAYWEQLIKRRVTLGEAVESGKIADLGSAKGHVTSVDLNVRHDRVFPKLPKTGETLLTGKWESIPMEVA